VIRIIFSTLVEDDRYGSEGDQIVDDGRFLKQALNRRQRRFGTNLSALALETFQQRGFLAADIRAGAEPRLDVEGAPRTEHREPEQALLAGYFDCPVHLAESMRIFGTDIDKTLGG